MLLIDDEILVRQALSRLVDHQHDLELVGAAADPREGGRLAAWTQPDVVVVDVNMPNGGGLQALHEIAAVAPSATAVALSAYTDPGTVVAMMCAGAVGYVVKEDPPSTILEAIRDAALGHGGISAAVGGHSMDALAEALGVHGQGEVSELEKRQRIEQVLTNRRALPVFQPIVHLGSGRVVGAEGLSRFEDHRERSPEEWFKEAHDLGRGPELEMQSALAVLEAAEQLPSGWFVSVNLSPEAMLDCDIAALTAVAGGRALVVEMTQHSPVGDYAVLEESVRDLRSAGARLAIDDVGAEFDSLRQVLRFAPELVKLDQSLARSIDVDRSKRELAGSLIELARNTGSLVVAEGIESSTELASLRSMGACYGQGFFWNYPASAGEIAAGWKGDEDGSSRF